MGALTFLGWRPPYVEQSEGLDFLGLAAGHEPLVAAWSPGLTNAVRRARYLSWVPWALWRYLEQGGKGTRKDQLRSLWAHETFLAYSCIAHDQETDDRQTGVLRKDSARTLWRSGADPLPLRGQRIPATPSSLDAVNYGPSLERLGLILRTEGGVEVQPLGVRVAKVVERSWGGLPNAERLRDGEDIPRRTVKAWAPHLAMDELGSAEIDVLREVLFAVGPPSVSYAARRVLSLRLVLTLLQGDGRVADSTALDTRIAVGPKPVLPPSSEEPSLEDAWVAWRVIALLKYLRRAAEEAFEAVHQFLLSSPAPFISAEDAVAALLERAVQADAWRAFAGRDGKRKFLVKPQSLDAWVRSGVASPEERIVRALGVLEACAQTLVSEREGGVLAAGVAQVGQETRASLSAWASDLRQVEGLPLGDVARWLILDRGVARHMRVAAQKLGQHDTYRLRVDEGGCEASGACPVSDVAIRLGAMLSLLGDLRLIRESKSGWALTADGDRFRGGA